MRNYTTSFVHYNAAFCHVSTLYYIAHTLLSRIIIWRFFKLTFTSSLTILSHTWSAASIDCSADFIVWRSTKFVLQIPARTPSHNEARQNMSSFVYTSASCIGMVYRQVTSKDYFESLYMHLQCSAIVSHINLCIVRWTVSSIQFMMTNRL